MSYVLSNYHKLDGFFKEKNIPSNLEPWFLKVFKKEVVNRLDWLEHTKENDSNSEHVRVALENGGAVFKFSETKIFIDEFNMICDWVYELEAIDPLLYGKLDRITWKQALEHSRRWHEVLEGRSKKIQSGKIPFDGNCPVVLSYDNGYQWVWLKTKQARDDEGLVMGHCVGNRRYGETPYGHGIFSLRSEDGSPIVTCYVSYDGVRQAVMKGNSRVKTQFVPFIDDLFKKKSTSLVFFDDPTKDVDELHLKKEPFSGFGFRSGETGILISKLADDSSFGSYQIIAMEYRNKSYYFPNNSIWEQYVPVAKMFNFGGQIVIDHFGSKVEYYDNDKNLHREDGPALQSVGGIREWYNHGLLHREDGPAVDHYDARGDRKWYKSGRIHRIGGPAVISFQGDQEWWVDGERHRENGPAVEKANGDKEWWVDGKRHRDDGPAIDCVDGRREWWVNGERHREDGPAVIMYNGDLEWYKNGELHREDGPAMRKQSKVDEFGKVLSRDVFIRNGVITNDLGPAIIIYDSDGCVLSEEWIVKGKHHREDGPAIKIHDGETQWRYLGKKHRLDGPAVIKSNGDQEWWVNGCLHREDGPAIERVDGSQEWWVKGRIKSRFDVDSSSVPNSTSA